MSSPIILRLRFLGLTLAVGLVVWTATVLAFFTWRALNDGHVGNQGTAPTAAPLLLLALPAVLLAPLMGLVAQAGFRRPMLFTLTLIMFGLLTVLYANPAGGLWLSVAGLVTLFAVQYVMIAHVVLTELKFHLRTTQIARLWGFVTGVILIAFLGGVWFVFQWANMADPAAALKLLLAATLVSATLVPMGLPPSPTRIDGSLVKTLSAGTRILWKEHYTRYPLMMFALVAFLITLTGVWILRAGVGDLTPPQADEEVWARGTRFALGLLLGWAWSLSHGNAFRNGYLFGWAALVAGFGAGWLLVGESRETPILLLGVGFGAVLSPLWNWVSNWTPPGWHGVAAMWLFGGAAAGVALAAAVGLRGGRIDDIASTCLCLLLAGTAVMAVVGWTILFRPLMEGTAGFIMPIIYRSRIRGPGVLKLPVRREAVLYVANHAAWFDPLWLSDCLPSPCTPMMTSSFYDLPVIRFLMKRVMGTIRVPDSRYRKEAPEIQEAIAELNKGNAVMIFPEGYLRRKEEIPMRRFGRGVWQILAVRPQTPVVACWIEGGWGSIVSHKGSPPLKGKKFKLFAPIDIGVREPMVVPPEILADQMKTRLFLMNEVSLARVPLGLPPLELSKAVEEPGGEGGEE